MSRGWTTVLLNGSASESSWVSGAFEIATFLTDWATRRWGTGTNEFTVLKGWINVNATFSFENTINWTIFETRITAFFLLAGWRICSLTPLESCINVTALSVGSNRLAWVSKICAIVFPFSTTTLD